MAKYIVHVILDEEYDDIEADSEDEAFEIASNYAIEGGSWYYTAFETDESEVEECLG